MIVVRREEPGVLLVDFSKEPNFDLATNGVDLLTGLFIREIRPSEILVEDTGQLGDILTFISERLRTRGYSVVLDDPLKEALRRFQEERALVSQLLGGQVKKVR